MSNKFTEAAPETYARVCSVTGEGMWEGWVICNGEYYAKTKKDALKILKALGFRSYNEAFKDEQVYWTSWVGDEPEYAIQEIKTNQP